MIKIKGKPFQGIEYYHYHCPERGERYFKVDRENNECTQVIISSGRLKKGRGYMIGIFKIKMSTFDGSYYWSYGKKREQYLIGIGCKPECVYVMKFTTENQFNIAFDKVSELLLQNK